jgi:Domain of unknown function (DUF397)
MPNTGRYPAADWRKGSASTQAGNCVEVARLPRGRFGVRDSKNGQNGPVLSFGRAEWISFIAEASAGKFDPS